MDNSTTKDQITWNIVLVVTLVLAVVVSVLTVERERYLPSLYAKAAHEEVDQHEQEAEENNLQGEKPADSVKTLPAPKATTFPTPTSHYSLIVGSFLSEVRAKKFQDQIRGSFSEATAEVVRAIVDDETYYRVVASRAEDRQQILLLKERLEKAGYVGCWVLEK